MGNRSRSRRSLPRASGADDRRFGATLLVIAAVWAVVGIYAVHSQLPGNALELPGQDGIRSSVRLFAPQGWAFFTRSPREPALVAWRLSSAGRWEQAMYAPHSEPHNLFGLNRRSRAQPVELALLSGAVRSEAWRGCEHGDVPACLRVTAVVLVDNPTPGPLVCGSVGLSRQELLPWAWARAADVTQMPATVLRLEVRC